MAASVSHATPFIQLVSFAGKDAASRQRLLDIWLPAFDYVKAEEVGAGKLTSTYEGFLPVNDPAQPESSTEILAWETYSSEPEFQRVHMGAEPVKKFLKEVADADVLGRPTTLNFLTATKLGFHTRGVEREAAVKHKAAKPYTLVVTIDFNDAKGVDAFIEVFAPLAAHVKAHEPNTLTYEAFRSSSHANQIVIFERYATEADLKEVHWKSEPFLAFSNKLKDMNIVKNKQARSYIELQAGHWGQE